jgi:hypothetical protein
MCADIDRLQSLEDAADRFAIPDDDSEIDFGQDAEVTSRDPSVSVPSPLVSEGPPAQREETLRPAQLSFSEGFAFDIACGTHTPEQVCERWDIKLEYYEWLRTDELFRKAVEAYTDKIKRDGVSVQLKASIMLEHCLPVYFDIAKDATIDPDTRLRAVEKISGLAGAKNQTSDVPQGFTMNISLGNAQLDAQDVNEKITTIDLVGDN